MITQEEINVMVKEQFESMQSSLNNLEEYLADTTEHASSIGFEVGKMHKEFELLVALLDIKFD
jgi:hypothetical protein